MELAEHYGPPSGTAPKTGDGLVKVVLNFLRDDGLTGMNVFGINTNAAGPVDAATLTSICNDFSNWWQHGDGTHDLRHIMSTGMQLASITAKDLSVVDGTIIELSTALFGEDTGDDLTAGLTFAVTHRSARSGRSHRGRTFVFGATVNALLSGSKDVADGTWVTNLIAAFGGLLAGTTKVNNSGRTLSVFSYSNANAYRANISAVDVISFGAYDNNMDYQRRRAPGHNRHF